MRRMAWGVVIILSIALSLGGVAAQAPAAAPKVPASVTLNAVLYPDDQKVDLGFQTTERAPKAVLSGSVRIQGGQAQIDVSWKKLEPALLFGGDVDSWVLWTVAPDGTAQSLGELPVNTDRSGSVRFSTAFKNFALMVTAEPLPIVRRPSDIVAFVSLPSKDKRTKNGTFEFSAFRPLTNRENESIATMEYKDKTPVELQQARRAITLMDRYEAEKFAQSAARDARTSLSQAEDAYQGRVGKAKDVPDLSRRTVSLASEAVRVALKALDEKKVQETEAKRLAELQQKQAETEAERAARMKTEADLASVEQQRKALEIEYQKVQTQKAAVEADRDALQKRLSGALGKVATTEKTGRGLVVSLSGGILFGSGKSQLRNDAQVTLAKLSGILLMIPTASIAIEGHTDATGTDETNNKLSLERASAVMDFLKTQGVEETRMSAKGLGSAQPVASNDVPDGRAKNRRVEIVVPDGSASAAAKP